MRHTPDAAAPTCILPDEEPLPLPPEVHQGLTYVPRLGWHQLDAFALAAQAQLIFARAAPKVRVPQCLGAPAVQTRQHSLSLNAVMPLQTGRPHAAATCVTQRGASAQAPPLLQPTMCVSCCLELRSIVVVPCSPHPCSMPLKAYVVLLHLHS